MEMDLSLRVAQYVCTMQCMSATAVTLNSERVEQNSTRRFFMNDIVRLSKSSNDVRQKP